MLENWIYFGVFLDADESERVYNIINSLPGIDIPSDWRKYTGHMTIIYNNKSEIAQAWAKATAPRVGEDVLLKATHVGVSDKAIAIRVNGKCQPMQFHISQLLVPLQESLLTVTKSLTGEK